MKRKGFAEMKACPGRMFAEIASPMLAPDQQRRLAMAWMSIYLSGNWTETEWRKALGYSEVEWGDQRPVFAEVLASDEDWALPFMREEMLRQDEFSTHQSARRRTHVNPTDGHRRSPDATNAVGVGVAVGVAVEEKKEPKPKVSRSARREVLLVPDQPPPPGVEPETWGAWFTYRAETKHPLTPLSARMCAKQCREFYDQGHDPDQIISASIANGWRGLVIPSNERNGVHNGAQKR